MIKLVAFDWNGTLLDDTWAQLEGFNFALKKFNKKPISLKKFRSTFDVPFSLMWQANGGKIVEMKKQNEFYFSSYNGNVRKFKLKKHAKQVLNYLKSKKNRAVIFSNHPTRAIKKDLKKFKIENYIEKVLGRPPGDHSHISIRSKENRLKFFCTNYKIKPNEVLCVGDSVEEVEIAKEMGYKSFALTSGACSINRFKELKPNYLSNNLLNLIKAINNEHLR